MPSSDRQPPPRACAVCGTAASTVCAACRATHYCCRQHQKQHWKRHKAECRPWKTAETAQLGRYLVATRHIKPGEVILAEPPLVVGPRQATPPVCVGCLRAVPYDLARGQLAAPAAPCSRCGWSLCRPDCNRWHSEAECALWARRRCGFDLRPAASGAAPVFSCVTPVRCLLLRRQPELWAVLSRLEHHLSARRDTALYKMNDAQIGGFLRAALAGSDVIASDDSDDDDVILRMCALLDTNSFEVRGAAGARARAVYRWASLLNHDCRPNTRHTFDDQFGVCVRATRAIQPGQAITTCYTQPLRHSAARRQQLRISKCFQCVCARCRDPTELGSHLSSVVCPVSGCGGPMVNAGGVADAGQERWRCKQCDKTASAKWVAERRAQMAALLQVAPRTVAGLERALAQLDAYGSARAEALYALVLLYGTADGFQWSDLTEAQLAGKQELCTELLQLADQLTPGQTRFRGVLLFHLCRTQRHLVERAATTPPVERQALERRLQEAADILVHEPDWQQELAQEGAALATLAARLPAADP